MPTLREVLNKKESIKKIVTRVLLSQAFIFLNPFSDSDLDDQDDKKVLNLSIEFGNRSEEVQSLAYLDMGVGSGSLENLDLIEELEKLLGCKVKIIIFGPLEDERNRLIEEYSVSFDNEEALKKYYGEEDLANVEYKAVNNSTEESSSLAGNKRSFTNNIGKAEEQQNKRIKVVKVSDDRIEVKLRLGIPKTTEIDVSTFTSQEFIDFLQEAASSFVAEKTEKLRPKS